MTIWKRPARWTLEHIVGRTATERVADTYRDWLSPSAVAYRALGSGRRSRKHLKKLRNAFAGERCFIIGNGPSLAVTDLALLKDEHTFGLNRGYLLLDRLGGPTTFLVAVNRLVIDQFSSEILASQSLRFLSWYSRDLVSKDADAIFVRGSAGPRFCEDVAEQGAWEGATVTYVALQLAFYMGFNEVILVGVDHAFSSKGQPHRVVVSDGPDLNHFDPKYFGAGVRWQLPDLETSELAYRLAKSHFERAGRRIFDATIGGKLTIFPKADYATVTGPSSGHNAI
jgi:hypothetical protein